MLVGLIAALQLAFPDFFNDYLGYKYISFGRIRPLHTNAVIFAFVGNAIFTGVYYSLQRLLKTRMWSDKLSYLNFWGWQLIIVSAVITLPMGFTSTKEYAELEWPIEDRKSTRLNPSHVRISYAVFCLKKKKTFHIQLYNLQNQIGNHHSYFNAFCILMSINVH